MVTTSTRVSRPAVLSPRTVYPMLRPGGSPISAAIRRAAARAATRRGSATTTRPLVRPASASGTSVVLPVPGGATRTAAPARSSASASSGSTDRTGRSVPALPGGGSTVRTQPRSGSVTSIRTSPTLPELIDR